MFPFHRLYSALFKSFDIYSETETINRLQSEGIDSVIVIKRSWIYGIAMIWIPVLITFVGVGNIILSLYYQRIDAVKYTNPAGITLSLILLLISIWSYLHHFRNVYGNPRIDTDIPKLLANLEAGDRNFIRFFDQTILNQLILMLLIGINIYFFIMSPGKSDTTIVILDVFLLLVQWFLLKMYRKKMIDLEMDYNIVYPGNILLINQSGMLSSSETMEGEKVKTVTARYPSWISGFFHFGTIEIMTEGGDEATGISRMYYVPSPTETGRLIQMMLNKSEYAETERKQTEKLHPSNTQMEEPHQGISPNPITGVGPKEVVYDVKGVVRDVLR